MNSRNSLICMLVLTFVLWGQQAQAKKEQRTSLPNAQVSFTGRTVITQKGVSYDWSGVYMQTKFTGCFIAVEMAESDTSFHNVFIDNQLIKKIKVYGKEPHNVILAKGLSKGTHTLCLQRATEGMYSLTTVSAVITEQQNALSAVAPKQRFIEVYGDSYTCGFGTESLHAEDKFLLETENCNDAYGCLIARYFDADYQLVCHSGQGIIRNYGEKSQRSEENMLTRHDQVFDTHDNSVKYQFERRPDIVLINLGTNDFSTMICPTPEQYTDNYLQLIASLRSHYGDIPILCVTPHSAGRYLLSALDLLRRRCLFDDKVYFSEPMPGIVCYQDLGASWHPNREGQRKIAMTLIPKISAITGWRLGNMTQSYVGLY